MGFRELRPAGATPAAVCGLLCGGFSRCRARALRPVAFGRLQRVGSVVVAHGLISCPQGMWDLLRPGIEPVSPALQRRFFTTGPQGKPEALFLIASRSSLAEDYSLSVQFITRSLCIYLFFMLARFFPSI